ncbi:MAG: hypothetical protein AB1644_08370 [Candidatus Zixiibacteriota bacterium]
MSNHNNEDNDNDGFVDGVIATVLLGCAAYGAYKIVENITKSPEQRVLENLGREMRAIDRSYAESARQISFDEDDDEE